MSLIILSFQLCLFFKAMPTPEVRVLVLAQTEHYFFLPETEASYFLFSTHNCTVFNLLPKLWLHVTNYSRI